MVSATSAPRRNWAAGVGLLLGFAGVVGYFVIVFRFAARMPGLRNSPWLDWLLIAAGLAFSAVALRRTFMRPAEFPGRRSALVLATANVALACAFAWLLYGMTAVPHAGGPAVGTAAPDFALVDQEGRPVRLADFRGAPLLLVFYRGHW